MAHKGSMDNLKYVAEWSQGSQLNELNCSPHTCPCGSLLLTSDVGTVVVMFLFT
jgi:hypothetical protein